MKKARILSLFIAVITLLTLCACTPANNDPVQTSGEPAGTSGVPAESGTAAGTVTTEAPQTSKTPESTKEPEISTEPPVTYATPATVDGVYQLSTLEELLWFMQDGPHNGSYALVNDIVFNDMANVSEWSFENKPQNVWEPIGVSSDPFSGNFNGNGHKITGLFVLGAGDVGMFGACSDAVIENLIIDGGLVYATGTSSGSFIGSYNGTGNAIRNCVNTAEVVGYTYVGGIVGKYATNDGSSAIVVENCVNRGNVTGTNPTNAVYVGGIMPAVVSAQVKSCANFGTISAGIVDNPNYAAFGCALVGGICGVMGGEKTVNDLISNCYNAGTIISCNAGANSGTAAAGGLVGRMNGSVDTCKIEHCYSTANVYTLTADSVQVSATCATKRGFDYATNIYTDGKVLVWNTETENPNAQKPACDPAAVSKGIGAISAMNFDPIVWVDSLDGPPILSAIPVDYQMPNS